MNSSLRLPMYRQDTDGVAQRRDTADTSGVAFRDPGAVEAEARALKLEIVLALVNAKELPVELPAFGLRLIDVRADRTGVALVLGPKDPIVHVHVGWNGAAERADIQVRPLADEAHRWSEALDVMRRRLEKAVTEERYARAMQPARRLATLPVGVPFGFFRQLVAGMNRMQGLVRTGFRCNQDCGMCWQDRTWGTVEPEQIIRWVEDLAAAGARSLIISGGEPMLDPELGRYVRRARELDFGTVILETNAIQASKPKVAARLHRDGVTDAFVSLHSGDSAVSDAITRAPGTHQRTVQGVLALLEAEITVTLNAVMTAQGLEALPRLPDFILDRFGQHPRLRGLMLSYPTEPYAPELGAEVAPPPRDLRNALRKTLDRAFALGLPVNGLDGPCGPPLCAFDADPRLVTESARPAVDFRMKLPVCGTCAVQDLCLGVRDVDVERFGAACVAPLAERPSGLAAVGAT